MLFLHRYFPTIKRILDNNVAARDILELNMDLWDNGYSKYYTWENYDHNFSRYSVKTNSGISTFRGVINGLLNEVNKLQKEIDELNKSF